MQNPEPAVDFDTVANVKQQHEINVGKILIIQQPVYFSFLRDEDHNLDWQLTGFFLTPGISNSFGFGGHNSVVAFSAFRP